ncbi:hypothetical protein GLYMA_01G176500v4 [Glycine max]|uniref:Major facilitator superfamily (MFS) profile domain-containing protein n=1 Tax=Glycine max TaxID=3847 RepID=A0A368UNF5_SOYBN|nr:hypothetical protein GLYMA_01G176500v4 [Glycine max]
MSLEDKNAGGQQFMENGDNHKGLNKYACASVLAANIVSAIFGYVVGVMTGALIFIKEDLQISDLQVQLLAGTLHLCALPGSMVAGRASDYIGRRYTIILASITFLLGTTLMGYGPSAVVAWWLHWVVVAPPEWEQSENQGRST